jgi:glycosyltransferase involved in cell wall biosynthesis
MTQKVEEVAVECILIDDSGQDGSMAIVHSMLADYNGPISFRVMRHEHNRGLSAARNTGLDAAKGDYILFIDSDDYLLPDALSRLLEGLHCYPQADMIVGNTLVEAFDCTTFYHLTAPEYIEDAYEFFTRMLRRKINMEAWNKLIRMDVIANNGLRFVEGVVFEDQPWSFHLFDSLSSVLLLPDVTYFYRNNDNSIIKTSHTQAKADYVARSYTHNVIEMLRRPPTVERYDINVAPDYLVFMINCLMKAVDFSSSYELTSETIKLIKQTRRNLMLLTLRYGRLLLVVFMLFLFPPLSMLQRWSIFRRIYYSIETIVLRVSHLTDFLHRKNML